MPKDKRAPVLNKLAAQDNFLGVLRRFDRDIEEVLAYAGHVCLYYMSVDTQVWARKNIEGSLFVVRRKAQAVPEYQMVVLNKLSTDNYTEPLHADMEIEVNGSYLMYTHGNNEILGMWFVEEEECRKVHALLKKVTTDLSNGTPSYTVQVAPPAPSAPQQQPDKAGDAFWDKAVVVPKDVPLRNLEPAQLSMADGPTQRQGPRLASTSLGTNNGLVGLLKNAQQKHVEQNQKQGDAAAGPGPQNAVQVVHRPLASRVPPPGPPVPLLTPASIAQQPVGIVSGAPPGGDSKVQENGNVDLRRLFAKASLQATQKPQQDDNNAPLPLLRGQQGGEPVQGNRLQQTEVRDKIRRAFMGLMSNDDFVDMLAMEFQKVGLV